MAWKLMAYEADSRLAVIDNSDIEGVKTQVEVPEELVKDQSSFLMYLSKIAQEVEAKKTKEVEQEQTPFDPATLIDSELPAVE